MRTVRKKSYLAVIAATVVILPAVSIVSFCAEKKDRKEISYIERPGYGELYKEYELDVVYEGLKERISLTVNEKQLTFEESEALFEQGYEELMLVMQKQNGDLSEISGDLSLPGSVLDGRLEITWASSDTDYVENNGRLAEKAYNELSEEGMVITMYAKVFASEEYSARFEVPVHLSASAIKAAAKSTKEIIGDVLNKAERMQAEEDVIILPAEIEGAAVRYYERQESRWWKYPLFAIIVLFVYLFMKKHKEDTIKKKRERELELSYTPIVTKLTLLTGAGSSIRGAWERLAKDYKALGYVNAAYEEIIRTNNEMKNGMSEQMAYGIFGKRCRLSMYVRLGNILEQNLKKGTKGLSERLYEEVREAFENRKALAVRLGEEAGTKLMFPMLLLLIIIIAICVVPAFLSM